MSAQYRITSTAGGSWAKNFPSPNSSNGSTPLLFDDSFASVYERFTIERTEGGTFIIRCVGSGYYISQDEDLVMGRGSNVPPTQWIVENAGDGTFVIRVPSQDLLWTFAGQNGNPTALRPANGSDVQRFSFEPILN